MFNNKFQPNQRSEHLNNKFLAKASISLRSPRNSKSPQIEYQTLAQALNLLRMQQNQRTSGKNKRKIHKIFMFHNANF